MSSSAHTWVEQMRVIAPNGTFTTGAPGYARSNAKRLPGVDPDKAMVHILPPDGTPVDVGISPKDPMCMPSQAQATQSSDSPRLKAAPGDMVALRYQENGHVTLPNTNPGKAPNRGTVYVYGTTQPSPTENFLDVFKQWNADGSGGNKKGKLLATQNFDDGQCYQMNAGPISAARQQKFPHKADPVMGQDLWCQNNLILPKDLPTGKPYTLYWVWDWATAPGVDPALPKGKSQFYTTCMDVDITSGDSNAKSNAAIKFAQGQDINNAAIPDYVAKLASGDANLATPSQSAGSSGGSVPASSPAAASSSPAPVVAQSQPASSMGSMSMMTVTVTAPGTTVTVSAGAPQVTSTTEVPRSTVQVTASANPSASIPTISLKLTGTATAVPAQATGNAGSHYKRGSAKFRNV
ncbi:MAG: hypothetical protein Q9195_001692 [Heterodermia aff. obscurata]